MNLLPINSTALKRKKNIKSTKSNIKDPKYLDDLQGPHDPQADPKIGWIAQTIPIAKKSTIHELKAYYKKILSEAILATNTSRGTQSRMRKVRGIDSKGEGSVPPDDHPIMNLQDPLNRSRLRSMTPEKAKAYERALNTAMSAEFMPKNIGNK
jgi:hypothetical protein